MKRRVRLRSQKDFQAALRGKRIFSGKGLVVLAVPSSADRSRVGVTVSRQVKTAVERNRARRRLREVARQLGLATDSAVPPRGIRYDVVLMSRPAALKLRFADLKEHTDQAALRLTKLDS